MVVFVDATFIYIESVVGLGAAVLQDVFREDVVDVGTDVAPAEHFGMEVVGMEMGGEDVEGAGPVEQAVAYQSLARFGGRVLPVVDEDGRAVGLDGKAAVVDVVQFHARFLRYTLQYYEKLAETPPAGGYFIDFFDRAGAA